MREIEMQKNQNLKTIQKAQNGITLVALVITIIIIIILATVTINMAFGDNGLITQAQKAKDMTANSIAAEQEGMNSVLSEYLNVMADDSEIPAPNPPEEEKSEVADAIDNNTQYAETTQITDDLKNSVWIPGGFHLASDSGTSVEEGIVIEDNTANKNQFVWIPVGTYKTSSGSKTNELTRRQWANQNVVAEPTPVSGDDAIDTYYYGEGSTQYTSVAKNQIGAFKTSATNHGGFYIGRYEQGSGNVIKAGVEPYGDVTRDQAKSYAESMYSGNASIKATAQLISSYAWDTALNFICQTNTAGYVLATTTDDAYGNIGTNNKQNTGAYTADNYSNIHDLLGNCLEWTTEYSSYNSVPCVYRGGYNGGGYAADHGRGNAPTSGNTISFRVQLYL